MLFNSIDFAIFLPVVFFLYWFVFQNKLQRQNLFVVAASYFFYGWWDWRFLSLIVFSTGVDFIIGRLLIKTVSRIKRRALLFSSIFINLGFLGVFKYYDFFLENFVTAFSLLGTEMEANRLNIILPVGISFYTFQTLSYTIDVYKRKLEPTDDPIAFAAFVSFFPQLVAGPIERAVNLLPQFYKQRKFEYEKAKDGMRQILWGFFKKVVIADNCADFANHIFANSAEMHGSTLLVGALFFTFQIYCDFSGYSDIAIGTARLFGFSLMQNFAFPYFSRDIAEFWRRWHISLSTWFRDYLYIPLGGSRGGLGKKVQNTFIIFIVSGFWHGANWTFIVWGALNALFFLPLLLFSRNRTHLDTVAKNRLFPTLRESVSMLSTFALTVLAWIFFRAENVAHAWAYLNGIFDKSLFTHPELMPGYVWLLIGALVLVEWLQREKKHGLQIENNELPKWMRWICYLVIFILVSMYFNKGNTFIYFQF